VWGIRIPNKAVRTEWEALQSAAAELRKERRERSHKVNRQITAPFVQPFPRNIMRLFTQCRPRPMGSVGRAKGEKKQRRVGYSCIFEGNLAESRNESRKQNTLLGAVKSSGGKRAD
jgi:hypothetical protein